MTTTKFAEWIADDPPEPTAADHREADLLRCIAQLREALCAGTAAIIATQNHENIITRLAVAMAEAANAPEDRRRELIAVLQQAAGWISGDAEPEAYP